MIAFLDGIIDLKSAEHIILNVNGIGYEINISNSALARLPEPGQQAKLYIYETTSMYGGGVSLYGFLTLEEKDIFMSFKDNLKNTGAKKALDYTDKAMKSLPDFTAAINQKNLKLLISIFGFRSNTAEKLVVALQGKLDKIKLPSAGKEKWSLLTDNKSIDAIQALISLGYKELQAKIMVEKVITEYAGTELKIENIIKLALKQL